MDKTKTVGRVVGLWRYPVKAMAGEALAEVNVSWHGLAGDRRFGFIRDSATPMGFPRLTIRERADMGSYRPSFADPAPPDESGMDVRTPSGAVLDIADPALGAELWHEGARLIRQRRGIFDAFPLSLITTQSIARVGATVGAPLDVRRFRPNLVVEANEDAPLLEDGWLGCVLRIGGLRMRVDQRDSRCVVITTDPLTAKRDPAILRVVNADRQGKLGVYGSTVEPGRVAIGDAVLIEAAD